MKSRKSKSRGEWRFVENPFTHKVSRVAHFFSGAFACNWNYVPAREAPSNARRCRTCLRGKKRGWLE